MSVRLFVGCAFQPSSDLAVVLPGSGSAVQMRANLTVDGTHASGLGSSSADGSAAPLSFEQAAYTVVAGDE